MFPKASQEDYAYIHEHQTIGTADIMHKTVNGFLYEWL